MTDYEIGIAVGVLIAWPVVSIGVVGAGLCGARPRCCIPGRLGYGDESRQDATVAGTSS